MTTTPMFDPLLTWLRADSRSIRESGDVIVIASDEESLQISRDARGWRVRKTWRNQDRGTVFIASAAEDVDRYLTLHFANEIPAERGLRPVRHGVELQPDGAAPAFGQPGGGLQLLIRDAAGAKVPSGTSTSSACSTSIGG